MQNSTRRIFLATGACLAATALAPRLGLADAPLLEVTGNLAGGQPVSFTDAQLAALPGRKFATSTIWTQDVETFEGPLLKSVLEAAGAAATGDLVLEAANDYTMTMPRSFVRGSAPIIALRRNGKPFPLRDKGPLWLVFPFDDSDRYQREDIYAFSVWQLTRITVTGG